MSDHKFKLGQNVTFLSSRAGGPAPRDKFEIVRLLPSESRDVQYRVKNVLDGHERVVAESQIVRTDDWNF